MEEKIVTRQIVVANGWDKLEVITADLLEGYTVIGVNAFKWCSVREITLPDTITVIANYAFYSTPLKRVVLPETITHIGWSTFESCYELEEVIFKGKTLDILEWDCFAHCHKLKKIKIPKNCSKINPEVFKCCSTITYKFEIQDYSKPVVAYKGFRKDMFCMNDFQYEEGETYVFEGEPKLCECGFHACLNPLDVFSYCYSFSKCVYHEVILEGVSKERSEDSKVVAKKITIGRELTKEEIREIFNKKVNSEE